MTKNAPIASEFAFKRNGHLQVHFSVPSHSLRPRSLRQHRYRRASHSSRRGQPAATHSRSSSTRHSVERPIRTGCGIHPAASHVRHVRSDLPHMAAASRAEASSGTTVLDVFSPWFPLAASEYTSFPRIGTDSAARLPGCRIGGAGVEASRARAAGGGVIGQPPLRSARRVSRTRAPQAVPLGHSPCGVWYRCELLSRCDADFFR